jgi:glycosyltransferase involved in cell wall biosynthesis
LVFAGDGDWKVNARNTHVQGRVSEAEKFDAIREALAVVVPSRLESLSLVTLEAFACGTPVIGNAASDVVQGHLTRSKAGFAYSDRDSYAEAVARVQSERKELTHKAFSYSRQFRWEKVIEAYQEELERVF